jgi:aminomethyltransferase
VEGAPAREGAKIYSAEDGKMDLSSATPIGVVTSGTFSPMYVALYAIDTLLSLHWSMCSLLCSLKAPIAMGYVQTSFSDLGKKVAVEVRGKLYPATVAKMPFVPHQYFKPAGK